MRIKTAVSVHAGVEHEADLVTVRQNAVDESPAELAQLFFAFGVPEQVLSVFADGNVGVHAVAVYTDHRLGQERSCQSHSGRNLAADEFIQLDLVGRGHTLP